MPCGQLPGGGKLELSWDVVWVCWCVCPEDGAQGWSSALSRML